MPISFISKKINDNNNNIEPIIPKKGYVPPGIQINNIINEINDNKEDIQIRNNIIEEFEEE